MQDDLFVAQVRAAAGAGEAAGESPGYGYRLLRYIDRKLPASDRAEPSKPRGIPVLFVPGHLGSFEQVHTVCTQVRRGGDFSSDGERRASLGVFLLWCIPPCPSCVCGGKW